MIRKRPLIPLLLLAAVTTLSSGQKAESRGMWKMFNFFNFMCNSLVYIDSERCKWYR